jgi:hypothetical protein
VFMGALGQLEGRYSLELPFWLDVVACMLFLGFLVLFARNSNATAIETVWFVGAILFVLCHFTGFISLANPALDRVLRVVSVNMSINVGVGLMSIASVFWLIRRFSFVRQEWADDGVYILGGVVALVGVSVGLTPLFALGTMPAIANLVPFIAFIGMTMMGARVYRGLNWRNASSANTATFSGHWVALAMVLWFVGFAMMSVLALPNIAPLTQGTRLSEAQNSLITWGALAIVLGMLNQVTTEIRSRIHPNITHTTGLLPFWLVGMGMVAVASVYTMVGVVQTFSERVFSIGYLNTQEALAGVLALGVLAVGCLLVGVLIYALGLWARSS